MDLILFGCSVIYLLLLIVFRKIFKISSYVSLIIIFFLIIIFISIKMNIKEIHSHAAHWAPLFMLLFAIYINIIFFSFAFVISDLVIYYKQKKK